MASCFGRLLAKCLGKEGPDCTASGTLGHASGPAAGGIHGSSGRENSAAGGGGGKAPAPAGPPPPPPIWARCVCEGAGIQEVGGFAGRCTSFSVACLREGGNGFESFVTSNLLVEISGPTALIPTINSSPPGAKVSYTALKSGTYTLAVTYFAEHIPGSPFKVEILAGKTDGRNSSIEHPSGAVQSVVVVPLYMECRIKVTSRDKCDNERTAGGLSAGYRVVTKLLAEDVEEDSSPHSRIEQEDRAWRLARERPALAGPLRKRRFGGFSGWEALHFCLAGDALFYSLTPSDTAPRGTLYLEGCRVKAAGPATFEVFVPLAYSRANLVKEKQVNRIFTFRGQSVEDAARWMKAIEQARPLTEEQLLQERDGHKEGRGFAQDDILKLRAAIAASAGSQDQVAQQLELERQVHAARVAKGWRPGADGAGGGGGEEGGRGAENDNDGDEGDHGFVRVDIPDDFDIHELGPNAPASPPSSSAKGGEGLASAGAGAEAGEGVLTKQARVQRAMRDPSLTPQERQQRIREIMAGPAEVPAAGAGAGMEVERAGGRSSGGGVTLTKQERVRAAMQDEGLTAPERQRKIQAIMRENSPAGGGGSRTDGSSKGNPNHHGSSDGPDHEEERLRLKQAQARVKALVAHGMATMGETNVIKHDEPVPALAADRAVDVRVILGVDEGSQVGEEDVLSLGVMSGSSSIREVKATATFGVEQLALTAVHLFAPARTRLVVAQTGQVLEEEDKPIATVAAELPELSLLLVPRQLQGAVLGHIQAAKEAGEEVAAAAGGGGAADEEGGGEESEEDDFETEMGMSDTACVSVTEDNGDGTYWLNLSFVARGVHACTVLYKGAPLKRGTFQAIVLKPDTYNTLKARANAKPQQPRKAKAVAEGGAEVEREQAAFSATLLSEPGFGAQQWTAVDVRFTHRQMMLYKAGGAIEALTGFKAFNARMYACPIRKSVTFAPATTGGPQVVIADGTGRELVLSSPDRIYIQATFYLLLQARMAGVGGTFEARRGVLQRLLQRKAPSPSGAQVLRVRRSKLVSDAFEKSSGFTDAAWRQEWQIRFDGEQGVDWGGLQREFFTVLGRQLFDPTIPRGGGLLWVRMGSESGALVHPNGQALGERQLRYFNFAGRVMAKCLYDSVVKGSHHLLTVHFTRSLFKSVLGEPVSYNDFETDDPELFKAKVRFVLQNTINDAGLDLTFAEEHYDSKGKLLRTTPLVPGGDKIAVTDENKKRYLTLLARHRLGLVRQPHLSADRSPQLDAFAEGFYAVIPTGALENFDEHELELLVCGLPEIRASDLQTHVEYPRLANAQGMPLIQWFWQCVGNMSQAERARLLQFWTGSSQVPPAGFGAMEPKINIQLNHSPLSHLPVSHTCFNTLELPRYRSFQQLQQRLALAIQEGSEGFGEA